MEGTCGKSENEKSGRAGRLGTCEDGSNLKSDTEAGKKGQFVGKDEFWFGHGRFELSLGHPFQHVQKVVGDVGMEVERETRSVNHCRDDK